MTTNDYFRRAAELADPKYKTLTSEDVFALQSTVPAFHNPTRDKLLEQVRADIQKTGANEQMRKRAMMEDTWLGIVTPAEMGKLIEGIEKHTIASKESCDEMLKIMRAQQSGTRKLPHWLTVPVAHKTGETAGVTNDVGVIYTHSGPVVVAAYTIGYTGNTGEADDRLGQAARLIVEYFDGAEQPRGRR
jgi:beta-lactamase class A